MNCRKARTLAIDWIMGPAPIKDVHIYGKRRLYRDCGFASYWKGTTPVTANVSSRSRLPTIFVTFRIFEGVRATARGP